MPVKAVYTDLDMQSVNKILNLAQATAPGDAVTFEQWQAAIEGNNNKDNARVSTQSNINLAAPGATIDGITMVASDRFLVRNQTSALENGIYVWNGAASAATRSTDANTFDELESAIVAVDEGTDAGKSFRQTQVNGVIGVNNVLWVSFGAGASQATETQSGIAELATQVETDTGTDDLRIVTPLKLKSSVFASRGYTALFGDGSATQYDFTHNLNNNVVVQIVEEATGEYIEAKITRINANTTRINMTPAPAVNAFRVLVHRVGG